MNISGVKKHMEKVLDFVTSRIESKSAMYGNTKSQMMEIFELCSKIGEVIADNIDSIPKRGGKPSSSTKILEENVAELFKQVGELKTIITSNSVLIKSDTMNNSKINFTSDKSKLQTSLTTKTTLETKQTTWEIKNTKKEYISPYAAKVVLRRYAEVLENSAKQESNIVTVNLCRDLIWRWYDSRILHKKGKFRYSVTNFNKYIYAIVVCFGYHIENNTLSEFIDSFNEWIGKVSVKGDYADKFALPYDVNNVFCDKKDLSEEKKKERKMYANKTAAVLWDVLWDNSYSELGNINILPDANLSDNGVWDKIKKININVLDKYLNYQAFPDILQSLCIW